MTAVRLRLASLVFGVMVCSAPLAHAQTPERLSVRGEAIVGVQHFTASQTFKGIFGSANGAIYGGGVEVTRHHLFVRVDAEHFGRTGERAFALDGQVFQLGIPMKVSITPVMGTVGYRGSLSRRLIGYVGGGVGSWSYSEKTDDPADSFSTRKVGYVALGGVEWRLSSWIGIGGEGRYTAVPNAIGSAGLSADLGEKDLGGGSAVVRVIFGR